VFREAHGFSFTYRSEAESILPPRARLLLERSIDVAGHYMPGLAAR